MPLDGETREFFEPRFGADFGGVRIHTDARAASSARAVNALAYTVGPNLVFGEGHYAPGTIAGQRLLAHELTHVLQQQGETGNTPPTGQVQRAVSPELEKVKSLLSYGVLDFAITDEEAVEALEILKGLPPYQQAVFLADKTYADRLRDNLPASRLDEMSAIYEKAAKAGMKAPTAETSDIEERLEYGPLDFMITDADAIYALEKLKKLPAQQRAIVLGAINYDRLLDNLPDDRKHELVELAAEFGPVTAAIQGMAPVDAPNAFVNSITFTSDYGVAVKDDRDDWTNTGNYSKPQWFVKGAEEISYGVAQKRGTTLALTANINVLPVAAKPQSITLEGRSSAPAMSFHYTGQTKGGLNQTVSLQADAALPNSIAAYRDRVIEWTLKWQGKERKFIPIVGHSVFATMDAPRIPGDATYKRMAFAASIVGALGTDKPHEIVQGIMKRWDRFRLQVPMRPNIWVFADELDVGGQCIDIVRFVDALIGMIGCPGQADAVVIYADPAAPRVGIEKPYPHGGIRVIPARSEAGGHHWNAVLLDGDYHANAYEAALKFAFGGTLAYYPGGVQSVFASPSDVIKVFRCLAWVEAAGGLNCRITEVSANYPDYYPGEPPCKVGEVRECSLPPRR